MNKDLSNCLPSHGILFKYFDIGVMLTGKSGLGKSDLMLQLLEMGAQLICDDAPVFSVSTSKKNQSNKADRIVGHCEPNFMGEMHIRDLGIIDIKLLFGTDACLASTPLDIIIKLTISDNHNHYKEPIIKPDYQLFQCLTSNNKFKLYQLNLPYDSARPMAHLICIAIKQFYYYNISQK